MPLMPSSPRRSAACEQRPDCAQRLPPPATRSLPAWMSGSSDGIPSNIDVDAAGADIDHRRAAAAIGHVQHLDAGHHLHQLAGQMRRAAVAGRRKRQLAGIGLATGDHVRPPTFIAWPLLIAMTSGTWATKTIGVKSFTGS